MKNAERVSSLFFLIASVFILSQSLALPFGSFSQPESGFFPTVISAVLLILSLALFGRSIFDKERGWVDFGYGFYGIGITITTMVLYAVFLNFLGYLVCTLMAGGILLKWFISGVGRSRF